MLFIFSDAPRSNSEAQRNEGSLSAQAVSPRSGECSPLLIHNLSSLVTVNADSSHSRRKSRGSGKRKGSGTKGTPSDSRDAAVCDLPPTDFSLRASGRGFHCAGDRNENRGEDASAANDDVSGEDVIKYSDKRKGVVGCSTKTEDVVGYSIESKVVIGRIAEANGAGSSGRGEDEGCATDTSRGSLDHITMQHDLIGHEAAQDFSDLQNASQRSVSGEKDLKIQHQRSVLQDSVSGEATKEDLEVNDQCIAGRDSASVETAKEEFKANHHRNVSQGSASNGTANEGNHQRNVSQGSVSNGTANEDNHQRKMSQGSVSKETAKEDYDNIHQQNASQDSVSGETMQLQEDFQVKHQRNVSLGLTGCDEVRDGSTMDCDISLTGCDSGTRPSSSHFDDDCAALSPIKPVKVGAFTAFVSDASDDASCVSDTTADLLTATVPVCDISDLVSSEDEGEGESSGQGVSADVSGNVEDSLNEGNGAPGTAPRNSVRSRRSCSIGRTFHPKMISGIDAFH